MTDNAPRLFPRWRDLLEVRPHDRDHWAALRVGLATAGPLVVLWAIGREDLTMYAVFGAFTSVYGRNFPHLSRLRLQAIAGSALLLSVALGALISLSPHRYGIVIPVAAVWAFGGSLLGDRVRWTPPGPMFQIFGLAGVAGITATPAQVGQGIIAAAASVAWALVIGYAGRLIWRAKEGRLRNPYHTHPPVPPPAHGLWQHAIMLGCGTLIAGAIPGLIGIGHPYWAMVSMIAALSVSGRYNRVLRATHRFVGTIIGLGIGAALLALRPEGIVSIILIIVLQGAIELFVVRNYTIALLLITPLVLMMGELSGHRPLGELIWERGVETLIGAVVAVAIAVAAEARRKAGADAG
ncbi:FUSC family protein [Gryllotalpicola ginsengisoli]|uniref:FUSC family protein n=1 Tax=Gryllotalpicola ginsengisoli TaxID=444608 RepID=UPI0003B316F5|nr:FUSC family protein [Gryllotalpicola ginsengisoli]